MRVFPLVTTAITLTCASAIAIAGPGPAPAPTRSASGTTAAATAGTTPVGTILFMRPLWGTEGMNRPTGSAIFSIRDNGFGERQLTPFADQVFNVPDTWPQPFGTVENWNTHAFSPSGRYSFFLKANNPYSIEQRFTFGKYYVMDAQGRRMGPLFHGGNDMKPSDDGKGYLTWGPAGANRIAYGNSVQGRPVCHACVYLIDPDGKHQRKLWCAPGYYPEYEQAIEGIRWSGDGHSLLVYASITPAGQPNGFQNADLYRVDVATGAGTLVQKNVTPPQGGRAGDVSYDGHEVVYESNAPGNCDPQITDQRVACARNLLTGQKVALVGPEGQVLHGGGQMLLTPDGSRVVMTVVVPDTGVAELFLANTDGTGVRQITQPCVPLDPESLSEEAWAPVRLSPDGTRLLANCYVAQDEGSANERQEIRMYVINLINGSARYVANGLAYDWHVPST